MLFKNSSQPECIDFLFKDKFDYADDSDRKLIRAHIHGVIGRHVCLSRIFRFMQNSAI